MNKTIRSGYLKYFCVSLICLGLIGFAKASAEEYSYKYQGKRDPFIPLITPAGYLLNLEPEDDKKVDLEGIMYDSGGDSMAIVNGELVRVGDSVGTAVITDIGPDKITILQDNQKFEVELRREE